VTAPPAARAAALVLGALGALAAAGARAESPRLTLSGPRWAIAGSDVTVTVTTSGALAASGSSPVLTLAVDGVAVERLPSTGNRTRIVLGWQRLAPGRHEITVKTGTERAGYELEVLPRRPVWIAVGLAGLALGASLGLWRRARRARAGLGTG